MVIRQTSASLSAHPAKGQRESDLDKSRRRSHTFVHKRHRLWSFHVARLEALHPKSGAFDQICIWAVSMSSPRHRLLAPTSGIDSAEPSISFARSRCDFCEAISSSLGCGSRPRVTLARFRMVKILERAETMGDVPTRPTAVGKRYG